MRSLRRVTRRVAGPFAVAASILLFATCDFDKVSGTPKPLDPAVLNALVSVQGDSVVILGGSLNFDLTAKDPKTLEHTAQVWSSSNPAVAAVNPNTGQVTGQSLGSARITVRLLAPELDTGWTKSVDVRVRYKGVRVAPIDSIVGMGPTRARSVTVNGTNNADAIQQPALSAGLTLSVHDSGGTSSDRATINANSVIGHRNGPVYVIGAFESFKDSVLVKVRQVAKAIAFPTTDYIATAINADLTVPFTARDVADTLIENPTATYQIADPTVATVNTNTGVLRVLKNDTTRIFVTVDTVTRSQKIFVQQVASNLDKTLGDGQTVEVATAVPVAPQITALDAGGTPVAGATVTFTPGPGSGSVIGGTVVTDANGQATVGGWTLGTVAGPQTLVASVAGASTTFTATAVPGAAARLEFKVQPSAVGVDAVMSPAVKVAVTDTLSNVVTTAGDQIVLTLETNPSGATLSGTTTLNAVDGVATFGDLALNQAAAGYTLRAAATGLTDAISNQFSVFGAKTQLVFLTQPSNGTINQPFSPAVRVAIVDANGSIVANATDAITLAVAAGPSTTLNGPVTVNAVNGVATFGGVTLPVAGSGYQLQANGAALAAATSNVFSIASVGPAVKLGFVGQPANSVAGQQLNSGGIRVAIQDANGTTVTTAPQQNITLDFESNPGGSQLAGNDFQVAATVDGVATFANVSVNHTGTAYKLRAIADGLAGATSVAFNVTPASAAKLRFVTEPTAVQVGTPINPQVVVAISDAYDNTVPTATASITLTSSSCTGFSGGSATTTAGGTASFSALTFSSPGFGCQLLASGGFTSATSQPFNVVPAGGPVKLAFVATPGDAVAGENIGGIAVQLVDASGQLVSSAPSTSITLSLASNPGNTALAGTLTVATSGGVATFDNVSLPVAASGYTVRASATGYSSVTSNPFDITSGAAARLGFITQPSNVVAGVNMSPSIRVAIQDNAGNTVTSATNSVQLAFGTNPTAGTLLGTLVATPVNGVATFSDIHIPNAGNGYTLQASAPSTALTSAVSNTFNVLTGTAYGFKFVSQPTTTSAGAAMSTVQVQVVDDQGNNVTNESPTVSLALTGGTAGATLNGTTTQVASNGFASFAGLSVNTAGTGYRLNATATGLTTSQSAAFDITPGVPTQLKFISYPSTMIAAPQTGTFEVAIADAGGTTVATAPSINITLAVASGPGTIGGTVTRATVNGVATFDDITLSGPGTFTITASNSAGYANATTGDIIVSGQQLTIDAGDGQTGTVGQNVSSNPRVKVSDPSGAAVQGVSVTFTATGDGTLNNSGLNTFTANSDASGFVEVPWTLRTAAGSDTLFAALTSQSQFFVRFVATAVAGAPAAIEKIDGDGQTGATSSALPIAPRVRVADTFGNGVSAVSVTFTPASGSGFVAQSPVITDADGYASSGTWTLGPDVGTQTLTVAAASLTADFTATATTADPCANIAPYTLGSQVTGTLDTADCQRDGIPRDRYTFTTSAPSTFISAQLSTSGYSAAIKSQVWAPSDATLTYYELAPTALHYWLLGPGTHRFAASSFDVGASGSYTFATAVNPTVNAGCWYTIASRNVDNATQELSDTCAADHNASSSIPGTTSSVRYYVIWQEAGQSLTIRMNSATLDPYLEATDLDGNFLGYDDDGAGVGVNSLLTLAAPSVGRFVIVSAMHYNSPGDANDNGTFTLTIDP